MRKKVELPTTITDVMGIALSISDLSLAELVERKARLEDQLSAVEERKLELRAINAAIRSKAR